MMNDDARDVLLRRSLLAIESLESRLDRLRREPIAVIGMACRFPMADDPRRFWELLRDGVDAVRAIPDTRANIAADPRVRSRWGGFLDDVTDFDADFFGIAPREAEALDPQQRLLLEVAWEALEDAAIPADRLFRSRTGVFAGVATFDYGLRLLADPTRRDPYGGTGALLSPAAGRVSYFFGFEGPSFVVDTACSSSLVALHLACESLRRGECDAALAGGVNRLLDPALAVNFGEAGMLAPDGRCKTFDAAADGFVRAEGCGMVLLKRLEDAVRDGDSIRAVIRGSAVNQDGRSSGLMAPNGPSQERVIRQALQHAAVDPADVAYVEAHGTGTRLGDPIEAGALMAVYGAARAAGDPLIVGALKSNIGHMEAASGVGGLIKTILALEHDTIPPNVHFRQLSPEISATGIAVPAQLTAWPDGKKRMAAVSAFGFAGTNAHVIVEAAPPRSAASAPPRTAESAPSRALHLLALSAKNAEALRDQASRYIELLDRADAPSPEDLCFTANCGRMQFMWRVAVVGDGNGALRARLEDFVASRVHDDLFVGDAAPNDRAQPSDLRDIAAWWVGGGRLDWRRVDPAPRRVVPLPFYAWQRKRFWVEPRTIQAAPASSRLLLGHPLALAGARERRWMRAAAPIDFVAEHRIDGALLMPASAWVEMFLAAGGGAIGSAIGSAIERFVVAEPLRIELHAMPELQTVVQDDGSAAIWARAAGGEWTLHATARIREETTVSDEEPLLDAQGSVDGYYDDAARRGLEFGPRFRRLAALDVAGDRAIGLIVPLPGQPTLWDACLQLCDALMQTREPGSTWLPVGIETLHRFREPSADEALRAVSTRAADGAFDCRVADSHGRAVAELRGIRLQRARRPALADWWHAVEWRASTLAAETAVDVETIAAASWREALPDLSAAAAYVESRSRDYIDAALHAVPPQDVAPGRMHLYEAWHRRVDRMPAAEGDERAARDAARRELALLERCGPSLAAVLRGEIDPVALLFPGGDIEPTAAVYRDAPDARLLHRALAECVRAWLAALPPERRIRAIEIGAGSGATTRALLPILGERTSEYVFSDVSPLFVAAARNAFRDESLRFEVLDIERDPAAQQFGGREFDLVVAVNVLHATRDLRDSLRHLHALAAPGALVLIVEATESRGWVDATFGLLDGWWRFADDRTGSPLAGIDGWTRRLAECGFESVSAVAPPCELLLPQALFAARKPALAAHGWRFLADRGGVADAVAQCLRERGVDVGSGAGGRGEAVADFRPLDAVVDENALPSAMRDALRGACAGTLELLRDASGPVALITREDGLATLPQSAIAGLARVAALELHDVRRISVDADTDAAAIARELLALGAEGDVALRGSRRLVPRLVPQELKGPPLAVRNDATYVVAGGTSGLGLLAAEWLARNGAGEVVIAGRRGAVDGDLLPNMRAVRADVTSASDVDALFAGIERLGGVIFAPGIIDDATIATLEWDRFERVVATKAVGAWNVLRSLRARPPEWLLLFASAVGILGNHGQASHAAANTFLDALGDALRANGTRAIAVDWGPVAGVGASVRTENTLRGLNMQALTRTGVFDVLDALFAGADGNIAVLRADWSRSERTSALFAELSQSTAPPAAPDVPPLDLRALPPRERRPALLAHVRDEVAAALGLDSRATIDVRRGFFDLGIDSLTSLDLRARLEKSLRCSLPATYLFTWTTPEKLAGALASELHLDDAGGDPIPDERELARALDEELAWLRETRR